MAILSFAVGLTTACNFSRPTPVELSLKVESANRPGSYHVSGGTNLPDQSRFVVQGIRYLQASTDTSPINPTTANYAILARGIAEVSQGKWNATLSLWQTAPNSGYYESWQIRQSRLGLSLKAASQVVFVAIFEPDNQDQAVQQKLQKIELKSPWSRYTPKGQQYLQVSQTLSVNAPASTPSIATTDDLDDGWGNRSALKPEPVSSVSIAAPPKEKQIDAPLTPSAFLD